MTTASTTLRELNGLSPAPSSLSDSALIMIDYQNTYLEGVMKLEGANEAMEEGRKLLELARAKGIPVFHIRHDAGPGSPYDVNAHIGAIADAVAPKDNEPVITKNFPNSFVQTDLDDQLKAKGVKNIILAGFMTHMCVNSTAHGGFNLGYSPTVVASTTATRALKSANGKILSAQEVHDGALASTQDLYAAVVDQVTDLPA
ncbi:MAG TPA: cysteine hydrolase [Marinobacter sp.]|uniref:Cysteine hydrolase n=2 Tax=root TaxID=1 RepID=A0A831W0M1_9GAMM|nr:cysteine hydrolase family protein [Marinobacter antarcticus]HDZ37007.1 cysteine hydrolase [Marinobacter sp.]HEA53550.1 cysteine hydrolase [Marinobacter antarcticus]